MFYVWMFRQRFWWWFPPKCNYDSVLIKVTCSGKVWGNWRFFFCLFSCITFKINKVLSISLVIIVLCLAAVLKARQKRGEHLSFGTCQFSGSYDSWNTTVIECYPFHHYYYYCTFYLMISVNVGQLRCLTTKLSTIWYCMWIIFGECTTCH